MWCGDRECVIYQYECKNDFFYVLIYYIYTYLNFLAFCIENQVDFRYKLLIAAQFPIIVALPFNNFHIIPHNKRK